MKKFATISELKMDDTIIPLSTDPKFQNKTFTVSDLHPCNMNRAREYRTVAVTLWDGNREMTCHVSLFQIVSRRWEN